MLHGVQAVSSRQGAQALVLQARVVGKGLPQEGLLGGWRRQVRVWVPGSPPQVTPAPPQALQGVQAVESVKQGGQVALFTQVCKGACGGEN